MSIPIECRCGQRFGGVALFFVCHWLCQCDHSDLHCGYGCVIELGSTIGNLIPIAKTLAEPVPHLFDRDILPSTPETLRGGRDPFAGGRVDADERGQLSLRRPGHSLATRGQVRNRKTKSACQTFSLPHELEEFGSVAVGFFANRSAGDFFGCGESRRSAVLGIPEQHSK